MATVNSNTPQETKYGSSYTEEVEIFVNTAETSENNSPDYNSYYSTGKTVVPNANVLGLIMHDRFQDLTLGGRDPNTELDDLKIPFQYIEKVPDWKKQANYNEEAEIMGRYEGIQIYKNSQSQAIPLVLFFNAESVDNSTNEAKSAWTLEYIEILIRRLKSLVYPSYDSQYAPPPTCELNIGSQWNRVPVKVIDVNVEQLPPYIGALRGVNKKVTLDLKTSFPLWQVVGARQVNIIEKDNEVFAYQDFRY